MVEAEVVMPASSSLQEVHDISLQLQNRVRGGWWGRGRARSVGAGA